VLAHKLSNRIAEYENRIQRLETLLEERTAAQPRVEDQPIAPANAAEPLAQWVGNLRNELEAIPFIEPPQPSELYDESGGLDDFDLDVDNDELPISTSTDTSLMQTSPDDLNFSNFGLGEMNAPLPELNTLQDLPQGNPLQQTLDVPPVYVATQKLDVVDVSPFLSRSKCDGFLPHPDLGASLLSEFLVDFNQAVPLFRPYAVAEHLRICYMGQSDGSALAWSNTYVVFGIAHRLRAMSAAATPADNQLADDYLRRLFSALSNLLLVGPSLQLIQTLLGVAILVSTTSHPHPSGLIVTTALRMAQTLAYNEDNGQKTTPDNDVEQQRRVFWIAFMMDSDNSMVQCGPTTTCRDDITASSPEENPPDMAGAVTSAEGNWRFNIFSMRTKLSLIQAEAIERILSVKGRSRPLRELVADAHNILKKLSAWRNQKIFQLSAEQVMQLLYRSDLVHVVITEGSYYAALYRIHSSLALGLGQRINPFDPEGLAAVAALPSHASYKEARRLLSLLSVAPKGDIGVSWYVSYSDHWLMLTICRTTKEPVIAALVTVFSQTLHNSSSDDLPTRKDMQAYGRILQVLTTLAQKGQDPELQKARDMCITLFGRVKAALGYQEEQNRASLDAQPEQSNL
jgi:hypothetical protein